MPILHELEEFVRGPVWPLASARFRRLFFSRANMAFLGIALILNVAASLTVRSHWFGGPFGDLIFTSLWAADLVVFAAAIVAWRVVGDARRDLLLQDLYLAGVPASVLLAPLVAHLFMVLAGSSAVDWVVHTIMSPDPMGLPLLLGVVVLTGVVSGAFVSILIAWMQVRRIDPVLQVLLLFLASLAYLAFGGVVLVDRFARMFVGVCEVAGWATPPFAVLQTYASYAATVVLTIGQMAIVAVLLLLIRRDARNLVE